jgi:hypothetical protein
MEKDRADNTANKDLEKTDKTKYKESFSDEMNALVPEMPDNPSEIEAALFKQAGNPLGDPHKI